MTTQDWALLAAGFVAGFPLGYLLAALARVAAGERVIVLPPQPPDPGPPVDPPPRKRKTQWD